MPGAGTPVGGVPAQLPTGRAAAEPTAGCRLKGSPPQGPGELLLLVQVSLALEQHGLQEGETSGKLPFESPHEAAAPHFCCCREDTRPVAPSSAEDGMREEASCLCGDY